MGPGSESMVISSQHQNSPSVKSSKRSNSKGKNNNNSKGSCTHHEESKSVCVSSDESGKSHHHPQRSAKKSGKKLTQNQNFTASYPQYHTKSKPIPVQRSISHNEVGGGVIKPSSSLPGVKQHQLSRNSPVKQGMGMGSLFSTPQQQRTSSLTPPTMASRSPTSSPSLTPGNKTFYAGAKFETNPSCMVLPPPPTHWTTMNNPIQRSHSQPSTPTSKSAPNGTTQFTPIDLAAFFGSPSITNKPMTMAKSFPGQGQAMMQALVKNKQVESESSDEELKEILNEGTKKAVILTNKKEAVPSTTMASPKKAVNTEDLKIALGMIAATNNSPSTPMKPAAVNLELTCHGAVTPLKNFKKMSDQLKSLMKVEAA